MIKILAAVSFVILLTSCLYSQEIYWEKVSDFADIRIQTLAVDTSGNVFAGTNGDGIYRSTNNGRTWENVKSSLDVNSIIILNDGTIFAGDNEKGVYKSTTGGNTWRNVNKGIEDNQKGDKTILCLTADSTGSIFAGSQAGGMYRSDDNGESWQRLDENTFTDIISIRSLAVSKSGTVYAGLYNKGIYYSTNKGVSWKQKILSENAGENTVLALAVLETEHSYAFAGTQHFGVFRSTNGGSTWDQDTNGVVRTLFNYYSFAVSPEKSIFTGTHKGGLFESTDEGDTWTKIAPEIATKILYSLAYGSNGRFYAGTEDGVYLRKVVQGNLKLQVVRDHGGENSEVFPGDKLLYTATVYDNKDNPLNDAIVRIYDVFRDRTITLETDDKGQVLYSATVPTDIEMGTYYLDFTASHDDYRMAEHHSPVIVKVTDSTLLILEVTPEDKQSIDITETVEYSITVLDFEKKPVEGAAIKVEDSLSGTEQELISDSEGKTTYIAKVTDRQDNGIYPVLFSAEKDNLATSNSVRREIQLLFNNTLLMDISVSPDTIQIVDRNYIIKFETDLKDYQGNPIENATVFITDSITGAKPELQTNSSGKALLEITVPEDEDYGSYKFTFRAKKNNYYNTEIIERTVIVKNLTGIFDFAKSTFKVDIYPNPAAEYINIQFESDSYGFGSLEAVDEAGRIIILKKNVAFKKGLNKIRLGLKNTRSGSYFVKVSNGNQISWKQIVINK